MIEEKIKKLIQESLKNLGIDAAKVDLEHPDEISLGDYSTNVAFVYSKELKMKPAEIAEEVVRYIVQNKPEFIEKVEVAGAGFINFYLSREFFTKSIAEILRQSQDFGKNGVLAGRKVMVEYTDPNPFKEFHIGHLMSNAIGESMARIVEAQGAIIKRACWQGDVGLHVAKALWAALKNGEPKNIEEWGRAYAQGATSYEEDEVAKKEIAEINTKIYERSDPKINALYDSGRGMSLGHFEEIYKKLGTKFDYYFFESKEGKNGEVVVQEFLKKGIFEESEGAVVFKGEKYGLHTRVFINSKGLPTYEAKELGLNKKKFEVEPDLEQSIIITANEQSGYFGVLLKVLSLIYPSIGEKTKHIAHGMLRFAEGKMSSRKGNVITGESLIASVEAMVHKKLEERELETFEKNKIAEVVAIGAIKYSILRQAIGSDIIYDFEKSISFEGDSGPYLQYSYVRANSVLEKAKSFKVRPWGGEKVEPLETSLLERLLPRFPEIVLRAGSEYAPHLVATYLIELASAFNSYYAKNQIVNKSDETSAYKVALTTAFATVMKNGLWLLGIQSPEKM